jgi:hypothetical protein
MPNSTNQIHSSVGAVGSIHARSVWTNCVLYTHHTSSATAGRRSTVDKEELRKEANRLLSTADLPSGLDTVGMVLHPMYKSLRAGGFTRYEALWIAGYVVSGGANPPEDDNAGE